MAEIVVKELNKSFKNKNELIEYLVMQNKALNYATDKIKTLEEQLSKSQTAVTASQSTQISNSTTRVVKSIPEALCQIEIDRLVDKAVASPLSFEDTKKLDILIRNYYLAKDNEKEKDTGKKSNISIVMTDEELIDIANKT